MNRANHRRGRRKPYENSLANVSLSTLLAVAARTEAQGKQRTRGGALEVTRDEREGTEEEGEGGSTRRRGKALEAERDEREGKEEERGVVARRVELGLYLRK